MGALYMIPCSLGEGAQQDMMSAQTIPVINSTKHYLVEDLRSARRFLRWMDREIDIDAMTFTVIGKNSGNIDLAKMLGPVEKGENVGVISEAGCPGIADPGSAVVQKAHELGIRVVPISGPSSFYMALMASGLNGQQFYFSGYLPKERKDRVRTIQEMERNALVSGITQLFMEVPFRNHHLLEDILAQCKPATRLCIAADISLPGEFIKTQTISEWKKKAAPDLKKRPCVFLLGR